MAVNLMSMAGWYFLPNFVTGYVQATLYAIFIRAGDSKPAPGTLRFVNDRRKIQICIIVAYLLYTIVEADYQISQQSDFFSILNIPHNADEKGIQSRFRRLTVQFHPDKSPGFENLYIQMKLARDTLIDPARRFAYERFGPDMLSWRHCRAKHCSSISDFVFAGAQTTATIYGASIAGLLLLNSLGILRNGIFWRYVISAAMFVLEMHIITRPTFPWPLTAVNTVLQKTGVHAPYLPFQLITLGRKLVVTLFIAFAQLGPLMHDPRVPRPTGKGAELSAQHLDRVEALAQAMGQEVSRLMELELIPYDQSSEGSSTVPFKDLRPVLKEWLFQNTVRNDAEVKEVVATVLERHRRGITNAER